MSRNISDLHPELQEKITELKKLCKKNGITIGISECLRTVAEQDALYAQGRTKKGPIVTNAKGSSYSSMHQWGVAFDFYLIMDVDGDGSTSDDAFNNATHLFDKVGKLGVSIGLEWGGNWKSICDTPHFQLPNWGSTTANLKKLYGRPDVFMKTWKKSSSNNAKPEVTSITWKVMEGKVTALADVGVNIRNSPDSSITSNKLRKLAYKDSIVVTHISSDKTWYKTKDGAYITANENFVKFTSSSNAGDKKYSKATTVVLADSKSLKYAHNYKTTANLNLRPAPGTDNEIILTVPSGKKVVCTGYYMKASNGTVFLHVTYGKYVGYMSIKYLKQV